MVTIAICDDVQADQQMVASLIRSLNPFDGQYTLELFGSGDELLRSEKRPYDLVVLDVQMPEKNGYKTAQQLRETDGRTILAFLTGVAAPTVEVFRVTPFRYLMKQMGEEELKAELTACFQEVERRQRFIVFQAGGEILRLPAASVR